MKLSTVCLCLFILLLQPFCGCAQGAYSALPDTAVFPNPNWQSVDPSGQGWNVAALNQVRQFVIDSANTTGLIIIHKGYSIFSYGNVEELSYIASCRKSVLAMLYGPFVQDGQLNLDQTLQQLGVDDRGGLLPIEKQATIRQLLTARSGVYHPASNEGDDRDKAPKRGTVQPGSFFLYNNWDFNAAGYILEKVTGMSLYAILDSVLARPLQMQDFQKIVQRKAGDSTQSIYLAHHMIFSTRDMARIGYLMLRKGRWLNQQVLPAKWVNLITSIVTPYREAANYGTNYFHFAYGYLWWLWDPSLDSGAYEGAYTASGAYGQFITVIPKLDIVIAHKTNYTYGRQTPTALYLQIVAKIIQAKSID